MPIDYVGTDPRQATDFKNRTADTGDLGKGVVSASVGLDLVTWASPTRFFRKENIRLEDQRRGPAAAIRATSACARS